MVGRQQAIMWQEGLETFSSRACMTTHVWLRLGLLVVCEMSLACADRVAMSFNVCSHNSLLAG